MAELEYIAVPRGDCKTINAVPMSDGEPIQMDAGDTVELTVRAMPDSDSPVLLRKTSEPGSSVIELHAQDTLALEPGRYSADIRYHHGNCVYTLWGVSENGVKVRNLKNFHVLAGVGADE